MSAITLDQLLALNEEISALVRAGVPLEKSLGELGREMPGQLGKIVAMLSERTARGEPLEKIIAEQSAQFPPIYHAVVEAGIRAGRLPTALESLSSSIRRLSETRRSVMAAALYPLLVLILICIFFAFFTVKIAPVLQKTFTGMNFPDQAFFKVLAFAGRFAPFWGILVPALLVLAAFWFWRQSRQAIWIDGRGIGGIFEKLPWIGAMIAYSRNAAFSEMFAALLEHDVPMHEALLLSADASGSTKLRAAVRQAAASMQAGRPLTESKELAAFPPLLRWLIPAAAGRNLLMPALKRASSMYRQRAEHLADTISVCLPVIMIVFVAGGMTLCYTLCLFAPYSAMLRSLAQ